MSSPYTPLLGVCPDILFKWLKLNIIEVGTKSPCAATKNGLLIPVAGKY
jgi:hypothetical protein